MDFTNKNVIITGGTTGIGLATAKAFISAGANVWITGRSAGNLEKASMEIQSPKLTTVVADTSKLSDISVLEQAFAKSGNKLDVLFLNAGIGTFEPIEKVSEADFDAQFNTIAQIAANELAGRKIRVNIVSPGPIATPGLDTVVPAEAKEFLAGLTALQRLGHPDEIAKTVLFLSSDAASFISGTEIVADGGYLSYALK
jgi:NAD(P)-dependent dehydrogenase (short-subunit alcohol dehydrogenase family)